jgi:hypothetical protein
MPADVSIIIGLSPVTQQFWCNSSILRSEEIHHDPPLLKPPLLLITTASAPSMVHQKCYSRFIRQTFKKPFFMWVFMWVFFLNQTKAPAYHQPDGFSSGGQSAPVREGRSALMCPGCPWPGLWSPLRAPAGVSLRSPRPGSLPLVKNITPHPP